MGVPSPGTHDIISMPAGARKRWRWGGGDPRKIVQCASWKPYSFSRDGGILVGVNRPVLHSLRSRRLEVVGERENGRARERHARGPSPLASTSFPGFSPTRPTGRREVMHQLIPASRRDPRADPRALAIFWAWNGKFPAVGSLELSNPQGWGRKKRANAPSAGCNIFH